MMPLKASDVDMQVLEKLKDNQKAVTAYLHHQFILKLVERFTYAFLISTIGASTLTLIDFMVM